MRIGSTVEVTKKNDTRQSQRGQIIGTKQTVVGFYWNVRFDDGTEGLYNGFEVKEIANE